MSSPLLKPPDSATKTESRVTGDGPRHLGHCLLRFVGIIEVVYLPP